MTRFASENVTPPRARRITTAQPDVAPAHARGDSATLALENFLPYRLNRLAATVSQAFRAVYGPHHDLTVPEWRVLATLGQFDAMTAKAIGTHSAMHKTKVSRAVRDLEQRRWLNRRESPDDRREEILRLTPLGRKAYADIVPRALAFETCIITSLGPDADPLLEALRRLEGVFEET